MKGRNRIVCNGFYLENTLLFTVLGLFWLAASALGYFELWNIAIIMALAGVSMLKPIMRVCRNLFAIKRLKFSSCISLLTASFSIGIPLGILGGFFFVSENLNLFLPTFTGLVALIFLITGIAGRTILYIITGLIVGGEAIFMGYTMEESFAFPGIVSGLTFLAFAIISRFIDYFITQDYVPSKEIKFDTEANA